MKRTRMMIWFVVLAVYSSSLCGCSSRNMKEELPGEWFVWHWYYNENDGENGFFDEAQFYTFDTDGKITIKIEEEISTATYTFSADDMVDVIYEDGTIDTFQLIPAEHDGVKQIQYMNINTNYTLTLEPMSSWTE